MQPEPVNGAPMIQARAELSNRASRGKAHRSIGGARRTGTTFGMASIATDITWLLPTGC